MKRKDNISIPLRLSDIKIKKMTIDENNDYHIYAACTSTSSVCHRCGKVILRSHGQCKESVIEDLPIQECRVFIHVKWPRFICTDCDEGPTSSFHPTWLSDNGEHTKRYEDFVLKNLINSTAKDVAEKLRTTEEVVEGIVNRNITTAISWDGINLLKMGIDEIALRKGHKHYLTIISDLSIKNKTKILAVLDGRKKEAIMPFFSAIPERIWTSLESITIDMSGNYFSTLKDVIGNDILFDKIVTIDRFHVAKLLGDKVDKERKKVVKAIKKEFANDESIIEKIKSTMWPFRNHQHNLESDEKEKLDQLFELAPSLRECFQIREKLYQIFEMNLSKEEAKEMISAWCLMALNYETKGHHPFESFVKTYYHFEENILNYFIHRHSSGAVEGLNNKIKIVKRRGFGFRNVLNFTKRLFLDINYRDIFIPVPSKARA